MSGNKLFYVAYYLTGGWAVQHKVPGVFVEFYVLYLGACPVVYVTGTVSPGGIIIQTLGYQHRACYALINGLVGLRSMRKFKSALGELHCRPEVAPYGREAAFRRRRMGTAVRCRRPLPLATACCRLPLSATARRRLRRRCCCRLPPPGSLCRCACLLTGAFANAADDPPPVRLLPMLPAARRR